MVKKISILQIISTHKTSTIFHCQLPWLMADGNLHFCKCQSMLHLRTYAPMYLSYICIYLYLTKPLSVVDHESCMYIYTSISQSCILCRNGYVTLATCVCVCFGLYCSTCLWIAPFPSLPTQDFRPSLISLWLLSRSLATFWWVCVLQGAYSIHNWTVWVWWLDLVTKTCPEFRFAFRWCLQLPQGKNTFSKHALVLGVGIWKRSFFSKHLECKILMGFGCTAEISNKL